MINYKLMVWLVSLVNLMSFELIVVKFRLNVFVNPSFYGFRFGPVPWGRPFGDDKKLIASVYSSQLLVNDLNDTRQNLLLTRKNDRIQ